MCIRDRATANVSFSVVQTMLLSNEPPMTTSRPACSMSAVSSTTTGGFPGPGPPARLPPGHAPRTEGVPRGQTSRGRGLWGATGGGDVRGGVVERGGSEGGGAPRPLHSVPGRRRELSNALRGRGP